MDNKRFFAIDALKAFAMLLVIIGHIPLYCIYRGGYDDCGPLFILHAICNNLSYALIHFLKWACY